jgi:hypothetical protein
VNLVKPISGFSGDIPTVLHEDRIFFDDKAFPQAGQKRRKKSRFVI